MTPLIIIPARLASTRLPGKPLAEIAGAPLIAHVWGRARAANVGQVVVAAGDAEIVEAVMGFGGDAVLTDADLPSGTDRVKAAADMIDVDGTRPVINLQGDMPDVDLDILRQIAERVGQEETEIVTPVVRRQGPLGPDRVKAVISAEGRALYFTRADAPYSFAGEDGPLFQHVGIYGYRRSALNRFCSLPPSPLERRERLEQLRALEAGMRIDCIEVAEIPLSVDTQADLDAARKALS